GSAFDPGCTRCPRLADFLRANRVKLPAYHNAPVPPFGVARPRLLIVGLAPGLHGANQTGRPFTGDFAGLLLYETLFELGLATRATSAAADDGLELFGTRITNTVKCVPPQNKPLPAEIRSCNRYLATELRQLTSVRAILALGRVAHDGVLLALGRPRSSALFGHARVHELGNGQTLIDSYHCSRYNTQTRRLTPDMFRDVLRHAALHAGLRVSGP
ncbi:MAG TPA: uracil-DNA glycosylase, partial [Steroidobacteraceae bacterium]|nr:uracil-DNA glycosylase [Steroidobacteraceae bacterium]